MRTRRIGPKVPSGGNAGALRPPRVSVCLVAVPEVAAWVLHGFYEVLSFVGPGWGS